MWVYHDFLFLLPGSGTTFPEVDPDPAKWYGNSVKKLPKKNILIFPPLLTPPPRPLSSSREKKTSTWSLISKPSNLSIVECCTKHRHWRQHQPPGQGSLPPPGETDPFQPRDRGVHLQPAAVHRETVPGRVDHRRSRRYSQTDRDARSRPNAVCRRHAGLAPSGVQDYFISPGGRGGGV